MKVLVALVLIGLVAGTPVDVPSGIVVETDYHNKIGIPLAARLKAAEEAQDFDGARIVGGPATLGRHPHIGGLIITLTSGDTSICGSSLLSNTRGITAAHCWRTELAQARQFTVVYGSLLLFSGGTRVTTTDVEMHANYNMNTLVNDIAIIRLPWVTFNDNIKPIALASGNSPYVGIWTWVSGWGLTNQGGSITNDQYLSHVNLLVITNNACAATYGTTIVQATTICASTQGGSGPCPGDTGGPLTDASISILIGVSSFIHRDGCQRGHPAGFSRITAYNWWIQSRL